jgi:hypothetical protein
MKTNVVVQYQHHSVAEPWESTQQALGGCVTYEEAIEGAATDADWVTPPGCLSPATLGLRWSRYYEAGRSVWEGHLNFLPVWTLLLVVSRKVAP